MRPLAVALNVLFFWFGGVAGLEETEAALRAKDVPFHLLRGPAPGPAVAAFASGQAPGEGGAAGARAAAVVTDMAPLRVSMSWTFDAARGLEVICHFSK